MTAPEEIDQLRREVAVLLQQIADLQRRVGTLEARTLPLIWVGPLPNSPPYPPIWDPNSPLHPTCTSP